MARKKKSKQLIVPEIMLWEYRAKVAEWEKAFSDCALMAFMVAAEKTDPKYTGFLALLAKDQQARDEVKIKGDVLKHIQERIAREVGLTVEQFVKKCVIDFDTGVVRFID